MLQCGPSMAGEAPLPCPPLAAVSAASAAARCLTTSCVAGRPASGPGLLLRGGRGKPGRNTTRAAWGKKDKRFKQHCIEVQRRRCSRPGQTWPDVSRECPDSSGSTSMTTCAQNRLCHVIQCSPCALDELTRGSADSTATSRHRIGGLTCAACSNRRAQLAPPSVSRCISVAKHKPWSGARLTPLQQTCTDVHVLEQHSHRTSVTARRCNNRSMNSCHALPGAWTAASACGTGSCLA